MKESSTVSKGRRVGRPSVYPQVRHQILQLVKSSELRPGDVLESEMALCRRFGVSRPLIRRALVELNEEGVIRSVPGKGHFKADPDGLAQPQSGVIVCASGSTLPRHMGVDAHVMGVMDGVDQVLHQTDYRLLLENIGPRHRGIGEMVGPHLSELRGMILVPLSDQSVARMLEAVPAKVKHVVAGRPSGDPAVPCVYVDHYKGMLRGTQYLLELGHQKIGYISRPEASWTISSRQQAYEAALAERGLAPIVVEMEAEPRHAEQVVMGMLHQHKDITAIITAAGSLLPWVLRALQVNGVRVPADLSLMSFDDMPICRQHFPAITAVRQPTVQMGVTAGKMLLHLLEGQTPTRSEVSLDCELVVRDSAMPVGRLPNVAANPMPTTDSMPKGGTS